MKQSVTYLIMGVLAILAGVGVITSNMVNAENRHLNTLMGNMFADYCSDKGGLAFVKDVEIHLPEVEDTSDLTMVTCASGDNYGILLFNTKTERVQYYIVEE